MLLPSKKILFVAIIGSIIGGYLCYVDITNSYNEFLISLKPIHSLFFALLIVSSLLVIYELYRSIQFGWVEDQKKDEDYSKYLDARIEGIVKNRREWRKLKRSQSK